MIRSPEEAEYERMRARFEELCRAAALRRRLYRRGGLQRAGHARCATTSSWPTGSGRTWPRTASSTGPQAENLGSSDMGNVSQVLPTIHPCVAICAVGVPGHSIEFRDAAALPYADAVTLLVATVVAQTAYELFADPALVAAAWQEFRAAG